MDTAKWIRWGSEQYTRECRQGTSIGGASNNEVRTHLEHEFAEDLADISAEDRDSALTAAVRGYKFGS